MARIAEEVLEDLKRDVSVQRLFEEKGVSFKPHGQDIVGTCPLHDDKTPSLVVSPAKNVWHCLGACRTGGSVVDAVMKLENVGFRHAVELLREGVSLAGPSRAAATPRLPCPVDVEGSDTAVLGQVARYYHQQLKTAPEALAYLETRGLKHAEAIEAFQLGFANRTLGLRLPDIARADGAKLRGRLQALGVMRSTGHELLNGSLVVPLANEASETVGFYGRKVTPNLRTGTPLHLYLPGPHQTAFNSAALKGQTSAIVCEAVLDALSFWVAGFRNVTAAYGVDGFTPHHLDALKRHAVKDVLIAFDRDDAGDAGAEALSKRLMHEGFNCWRVQFPQGMDANAYALKVQPASKALGVALRQAAWLGHGVPPGTVNVEEKKPAAASPLIAEVQAPVAEASPHTKPEGTKEREDGRPPPLPKTPDIEAQVSAAEVLLQLGPRRYRVRGLAKALSPETLKVNVLVAQGDGFHVDTLDMYSARHRAAFVTQAALELRVPEEALRRDLGQLLLKLESLQEAQLKEKLTPAPREKPVENSDRDEALAFLRSDNLLEKILTDFGRCGVVGEETNKLVGYLAALSRKLEAPLAVLIQSSSAAGKTSLMEAVLAFVPEEDKVKYSAMTGQSLFYMGDADLKHKVLAVVEEEGASRASYALKLLQSEGELTIASTGKNPSTGKLETHEYRVEGPTQLFLTTTATDIDDELLNRCLVLSVDEDRAQTKAIHQKQKEAQTLSGLLHRREKEAVLKLHQNAQRLLRPLLVANPFAPSLTFLSERTRSRRDFPKYLTLIRVLALLHQHQREVKVVQHLGKSVEYVEATLEDVEVANKLACVVLGKSLDELPPQTRRLLTLLESHVTKACEAQGVARVEFRFTRKEVREWTGLSDVQTRLHLERLVGMEYVLVHRGQRGQSFVYELLYDGKGADGARVMSGLVDVEALRRTLSSAGTTATSRGENGHLAGASRAQRGAFAPLSRGASESEKLETGRNALLDGAAESLSYVVAPAVA